MNAWCMKHCWKFWDEDLNRLSHTLITRNHSSETPFLTTSGERYIFHFSLGFKLIVYFIFGYIRMKNYIISFTYLIHYIKKMYITFFKVYFWFFRKLVNKLHILLFKLQFQNLLPYLLVPFPHVSIVLVIIMSFG